MGGYVDTILKSAIREEVNMQVAEMSAKSNIPESERRELIESMIEEREKIAGLDQPFIRRSFTHLKNALTLNFGRARFMIAITYRMVRSIILSITAALLLIEHLSCFYCYSLFGVNCFYTPCGSFGTTYSLCRHLIPPWFYGILLLIFCGMAEGVPFGGMVVPRLLRR